MNHILFLCRAPKMKNVLARVCVVAAAAVISGQVRQDHSSVRTPSGYELEVPTRWYKDYKNPVGNVICSVPLDKCQLGLGGMPSPAAAQIKITEFKGSKEDANREAERLLSVFEQGHSDRLRTIQGRSSEVLELRTIRWELHSSGTDRIPPLIVTVNYVFVGSAILKVSLLHWSDDPDASRYHQECVELIKSLRYSARK